MGAKLPRYAPLLNCIELLKKLDTKTVLIQKSVQDPDFIAEHSAYYSRWTSGVTKLCDRLHFFNEEPKSADPLEVIDQMWEGDKTYLGFVTLRPISMAPVAASIIRPASHPDGCFLLSKDKFNVNISGRRFEVCGTPFMQQDNAVGACAQASIWMALRTLRKKEGHAAFNPAEITDAATRFYIVGRTLPNRSGLTLQQVSEAVRTTGYSPHMLPLRGEGESISDDLINRIKSNLYPYVESGIPVLLLLFPSKGEGHAVVVIGHGWNKNPTNLIRLKSLSNACWNSDMEFYDAASWVNPFIIHNDNTGPYLSLPDVSAEDYCLGHAHYAIPLLHPDVFIDGAEAQESSLRLFEGSFNQLGVKGADDVIDAPKVVLRTYLQDRSVFRHEIMRSDAPEEIKKYYRLKWLPKRIWVTELNRLENYENAACGGGVRLGEILIDPAAEAEDGAFLTLRYSDDLLPPAAKGIGGVIIDRDALSGAIEASPIIGQGVSPLLREVV